MKIALLVAEPERSLGPVNENTHTIEVRDGEVVLESRRVVAGEIDQLTVVTRVDFYTHVVARKPGEAQGLGYGNRAAVILVELVGNHNRILSESAEEYARIGREQYDMNYRAQRTSIGPE